MKIKSTFLFFIISYMATSALLAGNGVQVSGARSAAIGGASATYSDTWSAFNNQAGLGPLKGISIGLANEFRFLIPELSIRGLAVAVPVKQLGVFALSVSYFGYNVYNEKKIGLAYARSFGDKISAGLQINYLNTHLAEGYGDRNSFTVEAGIQALLMKNLMIAAHINNPTRTKLAEYDDERIPTIVQVGLAYTFSEKVIVSVESEKNLEEKNIVKAGVEYHIVKQLYLRTGISNNPGLFSFGFGLQLDKLKIDLASTYHQVLGFSPQLALSYSFK